MIFQMLKQDEGLRLDVYKDTEGYWTVGIGHLLTKNSDKQLAIKTLDALVNRSTNGVITQQEAQTIFEADVKTVDRNISQNTLVNDVFVSLDSVRQDALRNMVFQMGIQGVAGFKNSLRLLKEKNWKQASINLKLSKWYKQTPNRANRVISVFETGTYNAY